MKIYKANDSTFACVASNMDEMQAYPRLPCASRFFRPIQSLVPDGFRCLHQSNASLLQSHVLHGSDVTCI